MIGEKKKMISRNAKTVLFASLIVAMIIPLASGQMAFASTPNSYDKNAVQNALIVLEHYVTIDDKRKAEINLYEAMRNGIDREYIKIAVDYVEMINKITKDRDEHPDKKIGLSNEDRTKFSEFFSNVKDEGADKDKIIQADTFLGHVLPYAYAASCNVWGPHNQPDLTWSDIYPTRDDAENSLPSGFSLVPDYASHNDGDDYADWVQAYGCADGVFRIQSIVGQTTNDEWQFSQHHWPSEPNPEIFDYGWPSWWWGPYVLAWHGL